jgi:hypothetical protein
MGYEQIFPLFPVLKWNADECPLPEDFFEEARKWVPDEHVEWLDCLVKGELDKINLHECEDLLDYINFTGQINADIALLRDGKGGTTVLSSTFLNSENENPLTREEKLLQLKWDFLESQKEPEESWGLKAVYIYLLQLKIIIRRLSFKEKEGRMRFDKICSLSKEEAA